MNLEQLNTELEHQYKLALVQLLLDEILRRLRYQVAKEKTWWRWSRTKNLESDLIRFVTDKNRSSHNLASLEDVLNNSRRKLGDIKKYGGFTEAYDNIFAIAIKAGFSQPDGHSNADDIFKTAACQRSPIYCYYTALQQQRAEKKGRLPILLNENAAKISAFGFDTIPDYDAKTEEEKRKHEGLLLSARAPLYSSNPVQVVSDAPVVQPVAQDVDANFAHDVQSQIATSYGFALDPTGDETRFLNQVASKCGFWGSWSSQYKAVKAIWDIAKNAERSEDDVAKALVLIDSLPPPTDFSELKNRFSLLYKTKADAIVANAFTATAALERKKLSRSVNVFQNYEARLEEVHGYVQGRSIRNDARFIFDRLATTDHLPGGEKKSKFVMLAETLPTSLDDLQTLVSYIFLSRANSFAMLPLNDPFLLQLNESNIPKAMYYAILLLVSILNRLSRDGEAYRLLQELLECVVLNKQESYQAFGADNQNLLATAGFAWVLSYLPSEINAPNDASLMALRIALLRKFPATGRKISDETRAQQAMLLTSPAGSARSGLFFTSPERAVQHAIARDIQKDQRSVDKDCKAYKDIAALDTQEKFSNKAEAIAASVLSANESKEIRGLPEKHYQQFSDKRIAMLVTLLEWYTIVRDTSEHRENQPWRPAFLAACEKLKKQINDFFSAKNDAIVEIPNIFEFMACEAEGSGKRLKTQVKELFPRKKIDLNMGFIAVLRNCAYMTLNKSVALIENKGYEIIAAQSRDFITAYSQATPKVLAILSLMEWYQNCPKGKQYNVAQTRWYQDKLGILRELAGSGATKIPVAVYGLPAKTTVNQTLIQLFEQIGIVAKMSLPTLIRLSDNVDGKEVEDDEGLSQQGSMIDDAGSDISRDSITSYSSVNGELFVRNLDAVRRAIDFESSEFNNSMNGRSADIPIPPALRPKRTLSTGRLSAATQTVLNTPPYSGINVARSLSGTRLNADYSPVNNPSVSVTRSSSSMSLNNSSTVFQPPSPKSAAEIDVLDRDAFIEEAFTLTKSILLTSCPQKEVFKNEANALFEKIKGTPVVPLSVMLLYIVVCQYCKYGVETKAQGDSFDAAAQLAEETERARIFIQLKVTLADFVSGGSEKELDLKFEANVAGSPSCEKLMAHIKRLFPEGKIKAVPVPAVSPAKRSKWF